MIPLLRFRQMGWVVGLLLAGLLGCTGEVTGGDRGPTFELDENARTSASASFIDVVLPAVTPAKNLLPAADPKMQGFDGWSLSFGAAHHRVDGRRCEIAVLRDEMEVARLPGESADDSCAAVWDGLDSDGAHVQPGALEVVATVLSAEGEALARASAEVEIVRLGISEIQLGAAEGGGRVPLLYRATDGVREGFYELAANRIPFRLRADAREPRAAVDIEDADGNPRALPEPWENLTSPPLDPGSRDEVERDTFNLPTAFVAGSRLTVSPTFSSSVAGNAGGGAPTATEIRVVAPDGMSFGEVDAFGHGEKLTATTEASPIPNMGRYDLNLTWRFEARTPSGEWLPVPGAITTAHRLYGLVGRPVFDYDDVPHRAWIDIVDTVADWVGGDTRDPDEVAARIVEGVYYELGLRYDRDRGASHYSVHPGTWTGAVFDASRFQERDNGDVINCSDAASIVSTYANMVGIDFRYHILTHASASSFDLNYIQAIGWSGFTETPFTGGRGAFRYHAVVGPPDGRFYDATLALDGDDVPTAPPHALLLAQGMAAEDYKRALSSVWRDVATQVDEKVRIR